MLNYKTLLKFFFIFTTTFLGMHNSCKGHETVACQPSCQSNHELIKSLLKTFPRSSQDVNLLIEKAQLELKQSLEQLSALNSDQLNFANTLGTYDQIGKKFFVNVGILASLETIFQNNELIEAGRNGSIQLWQSFFASIQNERCMTPILDYIEKAIDSPNTGSWEYYYFKSFLELSSSYFKPEFESRRFSLLSKIQEKDLIPYTYLKGDSTEKLHPTKHFTVLSWNVCFLHGNMSLIFGGVLPWQYRINSIIQTIKSTHPDVICLQEIFSEEQAEKLYSGLRDEYAHFYLNIGPKNTGLDFESIGIGSGLFIASKFPIENPRWTEFSDLWISHIKRGCFNFTITNQDQKAHIFTTHLESSISFGPEADFRKLQLEQILALCEKTLNQYGVHAGPLFLCGDMNIYLGNQEPSDKLIKEFFEDTYSKNLTSITADNCTYCDYTGYWWPEYVYNYKRSLFDPKFDVLDYALVLKKSPSQVNLPTTCFARTVRISAGEIANPQNAISDHHGLLTTLSWESATCQQ